MRLRILSDIHLELVNAGNNKGCKYMQKFIPDRPCPDTVLMLAGDIGNPTTKLYQKFIGEIAPYYAKVFIVTGNHEYYQKPGRIFDSEQNRVINVSRCSMDDVDAELTRFTSVLPNVHFLQRTSVIYNRVRFLGCTLWSMSDGALTSTMNDYHSIRDFTSDRCTSLHLRDAAWLQGQLALASTDYDYTVVMTHHIPSYQLLHPDYAGDPTNVFYASHCDYLVNQADIWICGHSHIPIRKKIGRCWCYRNPVGYQIESTGYDLNFSVKVPPE
jgi:predicted phosphodiesterase